MGTIHDLRVWGNTNFREIHIGKERYRVGEFGAAKRDEILPLDQSPKANALHGGAKTFCRGSWQNPGAMPKGRISAV